MPVYKGRRPGTWRVVIWSKGTQTETTIEGTKAEAKSFEARRRVELDADQLSTRVSPTFGDFATEVYAPHAIEHLEGSTWSKVRKYQVATLVGFFGKTKLTSIDAALVDRFKASRRPNQASSINNELRVLGTMLRFAKARKYPCAEVSWKKLTIRAHPRAVAWTDDEVMRLFDSARAVYPSLLPMLVFLVNTGCRKGEALACEWSWIDEERDLIRIPSTRYWTPKSGKPREVPLANAVRAALSGLDRSKRWVFPTQDGTRYAIFPEDLYRRIRDHARLTGGVHQSRHTFASHFLAKVPDMALLAQVLGHSTTRVTQIYAHLLPGHLERAKGAVDLAPRLQTLDLTLAKVAK
jgi:integrase